MEDFKRPMRVCGGAHFHQVPTDPWEVAARAQGWMQAPGAIIHQGWLHRYDTWQDCCCGESIKVPMDSGEKKVLAVLAEVAE